MSIKKKGKRPSASAPKVRRPESEYASTPQSKKYFHNKNIKEQIRYCQEYIEHPAEYLETIGGVLDGVKDRMSKDEIDGAVALVNEIQSSSEQFIDKLQVLTAKAEEFYKKPKDTAFNMTQESVALCMELQELREEAIGIFINNSGVVNDTISKHS